MVKRFWLPQAAPVPYSGLHIKPSGPYATCFPLFWPTALELATMSEQQVGAQDNNSRFQPAPEHELLDEERVQSSQSLVKLGRTCGSDSLYTCTY
jgi:hypothetical protein